MKFLKAKWENLVFVNYQVNQEVLEPLVPEGTKIDLFQNRAYVSLVAFEFNRTRVCGIPFPFHTSFCEVNLRFYVVPKNDQEKRSVTFIKEIVPRKLIVSVANGLFKENYGYMPVQSDHSSAGVEKREYSYCWGQGINNQLRINAEGELLIPSENSLQCFITEHYFGYAQGKNRTIEYEVEHPQWPCLKISDYNLNVDFEECYGEEFRFLNYEKPVSVLYAKGSEISVSWPRILRF